MDEKYIEIDSLCVVEIDDNDYKYLYRLADFSEGELKIFYADKLLPTRFGNRKKIYGKGIFEKENFVGIWNWKAVPNFRDEEKDYIESIRYIQKFEPVELMFPDNAWDMDSLTKALKNGTYGSVSANNIMFCYKNDENSCTGILCKKSNLQNRENKLTLKEDVFVLYKYKFEIDDILTVSYNMETHYFYKYFEIKSKGVCVYIKSPFEFIKNVVVTRFTRRIIGSYNISHKERPKFRSFISDLSNVSLYAEIAEGLKCSEAEAMQYVNEFIDNVFEYLDYESFDVKLLKVIVEKNPELMTKYEELAKREWEEKNSELVAAASEKIADIKRYEEEYKKTLDKLQGQILKKNSEYEALTADCDEMRNEIEKTKKLADDVEKQVEKRIETARENAAEFIGQMLFSNTCVKAKAVEKSCFYKGAVISTSTTEEYYDWQNMLDLISEQLREAGIAEMFTDGFAAFLYSCYLHKAPLLLAGICGESIANAFSTVMFGKTAGVLDCSEEFSRESIDNMLNSDDEIVIIKQPLNHQWINHMPELLLPEKKHYFLVSPFAEDLLIEPKSLFNYVVPIITEILTDKYPSNSFFCGITDRNFEDFKPGTPKYVKEEVFKKIGMGSFVKNRIQGILTDMQTMLDDVKSEDEIYLYGILPYTYFTGKTDYLADKLKKRYGGKDEVKELILSFLGEE